MLKKKTSFFSLTKAKSLQPYQSCSAWFWAPTRLCHGWTPPPCRCGVSYLSGTLFSSKISTPQGNCSPGKSLGTIIEGKQMGFETSYFLLARVTGVVERPPTGFRAAGPGPSSITLRGASPLFASLVVLQKCQFQFFLLVAFHGIILFIVLCPFTSSLLLNNKLNNAFASLCCLLNAVGCCVSELTSTLKSLWFVSRVCYLAISCKYGCR